MVLARTSCAVILSAWSVGDVTTIEDDPGSGGGTTGDVARPPNSSWAAADPARVAQAARAASPMNDLPSILFALVIVDASFSVRGVRRDACPESPGPEDRSIVLSDPSRVLSSIGDATRREFDERPFDAPFAESGGRKSRSSRRSDSGDATLFFLRRDGNGGSERGMRQNGGR